MAARARAVDDGDDEAGAGVDGPASCRDSLRCRGVGRGRRCHHAGGADVGGRGCTRARALTASNRAQTPCHVLCRAHVPAPDLPGRSCCLRVGAATPWSESRPWLQTDCGRGALTLSRSNCQPVRVCRPSESESRARWRRSFGGRRIRDEVGGGREVVMMGRRLIAAGGCKMAGDG